MAYQNKKSIMEDKNKIKKWPIILLVVLLVVVLIFLIQYINERTNTDKSEEVTTEQIIPKWNSDKNLIDDRLTKNYPIMFVVSPTQSEGYVYLSTMCIFNDGKFVTGNYVMQSMDEYTNESIKSDAFVNLLADGYEDIINTDIANLFSEDLKPSSFRNTYLIQYDVDDFSMNTTVNLMNSSMKTMDIYGVTYMVDESGEIVALSHKYYSSSSNSESIIIDNLGLTILNSFLETQTGS